MPVSGRIALPTDVADWYRFNTTVAGNYVLTLTHPNTAFTFNMYPTGNNAPALIPVQTSATTKTYALAANKTYYISITGGFSYVCYQMSVGTPTSTAISKELITESKPTLIETLRAEVFPNPHIETFNIRIHSPQDGMATVELYNIVGQKLETRMVGVKKNGNVTVSFEDKVNRVLIYKVTVGGKTVVGKIIGGR